MLKVMESQFLCFFGISTPWTQHVNWTYVTRPEDFQKVFWTSYVRSIYVLYPRGINVVLENSSVRIIVYYPCSKWFTKAFKIINNEILIVVIYECAFESESLRCISSSWSGIYLLKVDEGNIRTGEIY